MDGKSAFSEEVQSRDELRFLLDRIDGVRHRVYLQGMDQPSACKLVFARRNWGAQSSFG